MCIGTYILETSKGKVCIKATMGVVYLVVIQKVWRVLISVNLQGNEYFIMCSLCYSIVVTSHF